MADTALSHKSRFPAQATVGRTHGEASTALSLVAIRTARFRHTSATRRGNGHHAQFRACHIIQPANSGDSIEHLPLYVLDIAYLSVWRGLPLSAEEKWQKKKLISPSSCNIKYTFSYLPLPIRRNENPCKEKSTNSRTQSSDWLK